MTGRHEKWQQQDLPLEAQQRHETFARFGLAMFQAQCVERQVGILLATALNPQFLQTSPEDRERFFDTEFAKTLGNLVRALREQTTLAPEFESRLRRAVELRNWLSHHYFWKRAGSILTWDGREQMISELQETADFLGSMDMELTAISEKWLDRVGVSREAIEAEMAKYNRGQNA
jgi:hypothetical protein